MCPSDQFVGFIPYVGNETISKYIAIINCCAVLDVIGFHVERKSRKIAKIPNVQSDGSHIAHGIFSAVILSSDKRLCQRARAIFRYAGIQTIVIELKQERELALTTALSPKNPTINKPQN